jgi:hypothetical protein
MAGFHDNAVKGKLEYEASEDGGRDLLFGDAWIGVEDRAARRGTAPDVRRPDRL